MLWQPNKNPWKVLLLVFSKVVAHFLVCYKLWITRAVPVGPGRRLLWLHSAATSMGILIIYAPAALKLQQLRKRERKAAFPGKWLKRVQLVVPSHCESPSGNEYLNLLFLRETLITGLTLNKLKWFAGFSDWEKREGGRKENSIEESKRIKEKAKKMKTHRRNTELQGGIKS